MLKLIKDPSESLDLFLFILIKIAFIFNIDLIIDFILVMHS